MVFTRSTTPKKSASAQAQPIKPDTKKRASTSVSSPLAKKRATEEKFRSGVSLKQIIDEGITLTNQNDEPINLSEVCKNNVVIFLYPRANTPGCTKQACGFRDHYSALQQANFAVYGLSRDATNVLRSWKEKQNLPFDLISDPKSQLIKYFGSPFGSKVQRSHVVILKNGSVGEFQLQITPEKSVERVLKYVNDVTMTGKQESVQSPTHDAKHEETSPTEVIEPPVAIGSSATAGILLKNQNDESVSFQDIIRDNSAIFFIFPKANTPGCTTQAKGFNASFQPIQTAGFRVYGVSADTPMDLKAWKDQHSLAFDFLSDPEHILIGYFGSSLNKTSIDRSHVIVLKGGKVVDIQRNMDPEESVEKALAFAKALPRDSVNDVVYTILCVCIMGTYLEDYLESVYMLPSDVKRNFDLVRELDKTSYQLVEDLKDSHRKYLIDARKKVMARWADAEKEEPTEEELRLLVETDETLKLLKEREQNVIQKLDEKVAIAAQSYELVDHHIRRLDQDLEAFGALLKQNGEFEDDMDDEKRISARKRRQDKSIQQEKLQLQLQQLKQQVNSSTRKKSVASNNVGRKRGAGEANLDADVTNWDDASEAIQDDSAIDPNEPVYCHCRRVSFGQMVGCDNDDCRFEWFHFECVGLTEQPAGMWYCHDCKLRLNVS
uniref:Inhibitor of growth protein n=1 Tax=Albugo laibachii Nc14 TaxID=890382 RepID=F0WFZ3_9STRA|nr:AhpC/TSA family Redoxin putative [Albugo laibachii Nc14]|eukprot:CCA20127.1 AhpC/TSA family Redoxin putative [Albugo laibachii Nc14]